MQNNQSEQPRKMTSARKAALVRFLLTIIMGVLLLKPDQTHIIVFLAFIEILVATSPFLD